MACIATAVPLPVPVIVQNSVSTCKWALLWVQNYPILHLYPLYHSFSRWVDISPLRWCSLFHRQTWLAEVQLTVTNSSCQNSRSLEWKA